MALLIDETELIHDFDEDMAFKLLSELYVTGNEQPLERFKFTLDGKYIDYDGDLYISPTIADKVTTLEIPGFVLREVRGFFICWWTTNLKSLKGSPEKVGKDFLCSGCGNLKSLEGAPKEVDGLFNCSNCDNLSTLKGAPKIVGKEFYCSYCPNLETLEGGPKEVGGKLYCRECKKIKREEQSKLNYNIEWHY